MASKAVRERTLRRRRERNSAAKTSNQGRKDAAYTVPLALVLLVVTIALYSQVRSHDFINYDDDGYVYKNADVTSGLNLRTLKWSLTTTEQYNWHPLTWLSHALDCHLFGLDAGFHHLVSAFIHVLNALLLFFVLQRATRAIGRSFMVAALFALHPFNVQSVAWVAERKNVLSMLFLLLAIGAYVWYSQEPQRRRFLVVVTLFALALLSKPMAVTLPFLLLLLDYWPLGRLAGFDSSPRFAAPSQSFMHLLWEKWPLFVLSLASCVITVWAQRAGGAVRTLHVYPLGERFRNGLCSYVAYIWKTFWPSKFALFYPHSEPSIGWWKPAAALILLSAISVGVWKQRATRPYLLVGWLWFLGALIPMIGIVQVGDQAMADRYAYLPLIGIFVMVVWGIDDLFRVPAVGPALRWSVAVACLGIISLLTVRELGCWQNSVSVWSRTLEVTTGNATAEHNLAEAFAERGQTDEAAQHFLNAVNLDPKDFSSRVNLGSYYGAHGRPQDAIREFTAVVTLTDQGPVSSSDRWLRASAQFDMGLAYILLQDYANALVNFQAAAQADSGIVNRSIDTLVQSLESNPAEQGYVQLSLLMRARGEKEGASTVLENASRENPEYVKTRQLLSYLKSNP